MKKIIDALSIILYATRCAFSFCWRYSKWGTTWRIVLSILNVAFLYLSIWSTGKLVNVVQVEMTKTQETSTSFYNIRYYLMSFGAVVIFGSMVGIFNWYSKSRWHQWLKIANERELFRHRSRLDVATFKSEDFSNLCKRIEELNTGWQTRIWFSDEMLNLYTIVLSFLCFGATLIAHSPLYAVIIFVFSLPMMVVEFQGVNLWWSLFETLVPHHKKRSVMTQAFYNSTTFAQALSFRQMPHLHRLIADNTDHVLSSYDIIR